MNGEKCSACQYFLQHYCLDKRKLFRISCGHCVFSRAKTKSPDNKACQNFVPGVADTDAFVSKEYLSKELLRYVFQLSLLPEIEDASVPLVKKEHWK